MLGIWNIKWDTWFERVRSMNNVLYIQNQYTNIQPRYMISAYSLQFTVGENKLKHQNHNQGSWPFDLLNRCASEPWQSAFVLWKPVKLKNTDPVSQTGPTGWLQWSGKTVSTDWTSEKKKSTSKHSSRKTYIFNGGLVTRWCYSCYLSDGIPLNVM